MWAFSTALYGQQPQEGTPGLPDAKIAEIAVRAGVPQDMADSFTKRTFEPWVAASNESAGKAGVTGTPTITITGEVFTGDMYTPGPLTQAVQGLEQQRNGGWRQRVKDRRVTATGRSDGGRVVQLGGQAVAAEMIYRWQAGVAACTISLHRLRGFIETSSLTERNLDECEGF